MSEVKDSSPILTAIICIILIVGIYSIATLIVYRMDPFTQIMVWNNCKENVEHLVPNDWKIVSFSPFGMHKEGKDYYIYVEVTNNQIHRWTNDYVVVGRSGEILRQELTENIAFWEGHS